MGIIDIASSKSVWRGMDYYKQKKVLSCEENDDGTYEGDVAGSDNKKYHVHLDMIHPRKSKCNCPFIALYFHIAQLRIKTVCPDIPNGGIERKTIK